MAVYADVIVDITNEKLDRTFQYRVPEEMEESIVPGVEVEIPFGRGDRLIRGYVVETTDRPAYDPVKIKSIKQIVPGRVPIESRLIALAAWMRERYGSTMIQALKTVIPIKKEIKAQKKRLIRLNLSADQTQAYLDELNRKHCTARARLVQELIHQPELNYELVTKKLHITPAVIKALEEQGILCIQTEQLYRNPVRPAERQEKRVVLNDQQQAVVDQVTEDWGRGFRRTYLVHGVTGSGKTEVYMEIIARVVADGQQAIVLIPEIALTFQTVLRFYQRFGDRISIMNSRLSAGERYDQFERAKNKEISVMIGPRSALFTPFPNLGVVIIDEEHELTYKSENVPRYHARDVAIHRAETEGAMVVLGSATPSVDSYYKALRGEFGLFRLTDRAKKNALPHVYVEDLREELRSGNRSIFSARLQELLQDRLLKKEQVMLFLNRRGYAGFVSCRSCGHVMKCPHCDVSLSMHNHGRLVCHYCGYEEPAVKKCPECGSPYIGGFRAGTQQIEELLKKQYPEAGVLRMDADTTRNKDGHEKILAAFANREADILIGTQMIVKGHDFPAVTLVGVIAADLSLYTGDYLSSERTFQLLTQAAGRAGRGDVPGEVVIQTYQPEHYAVVTAAAQNYEGFYQQEILYRTISGYPPAAHLLAVLLSGADQEELSQAADVLIQQVPRDLEGLTVIGPAEPAVARINDIYKKVIYLKHKKYDTLTEVKDHLERFAKEQPLLEKINMQFDFNPMHAG